MLCPDMPCCPSIFFLFLFPFLSCHSPSMIIFVMSLIWSEGRNRRKRGSVNNLWLLPPWNWGIMIRILVPLLCCCMPHRQGGLCNWTGWDKGTILGRKAVFPSEAWRRKCLVSRTKKKTIKRPKNTWCSKESATTFVQDVLKKSYLQEVVRRRDTGNTSIQPFCLYLYVCCNRFSKVPEKLFSTSSSCSLEIPRGP